MTASHPRHVAVIDIGKTNAKLALVDLEMRSEVTALRQPNRPRTDGPYPHHDIDALWSFILEGLAVFQRDYPVDAISVTTHGATAALIDRHGALALPVPDYEFDGPDRLRNDYDAVRPNFDQTGSPGLSLGLNLGAQLFWLEKSFPDAFAKAHAILTWPQFWSWKLTGVAASEATSLGCHTDLWNPHARDFSTLVDVMAWRALFPPLRRADEVLGPLLPEVAAHTGINPATPVLCGIHDSNASLLPHLITRKPPFAVVSTGTWVVAMSIGGKRVPLDPARDTLVNVNAFGDPVPSARFMGGRDFDVLMDGHTRQTNTSDLNAVLESGTLLLPSSVMGSGPFPNGTARWIGPEPRGGRRYAAVSLYLALVTATCLDLVGAEGTVIVEGPFASNEHFLTMLAAATERAVIAGQRAGTGTSLGAALLAGQSCRVQSADPPDVLPVPAAFRHYAAMWRARAAVA